MKWENEYLSDDKLQQLILEVEQNELVEAPPDLIDNIMESMESERRNDIQALKTENIPNSKVKEFRRYCFRVVTSVAAAVLIIFVQPELQNTQLSDVPARQELIAPAKYANKEEALSDMGILMQAFGGTNIFDKEHNFPVFNGENGG